MTSSIIKSSVLLRLFRLALLTAEGRRYFSWRDLPEDRGYVGTRVAAIENRYVVYRLFGLFPVWTAHAFCVELDLQATINMFTLHGVHHYTGLDAMFTNPLCQLGHDYLGTGKAPGILQGMGLADSLDDEELRRQGWVV